MLVGGVALVKRATRPHAALVALPPTPAPPPPALADRYKKVEASLESGDTGAARRILEQALAERPKDGRVRYMLGRVAYAEDRREEALTHYRESIVLDPGFRGDPVLLAHVDAMLADPKQSDAALDLVIDRVGAPAADLLEKVANEGSDLGHRHRAADALEELGQGKRVDRVSLTVLELKKADTCEERKPLVAKLRELGDARALPALRGLHGRRVGPLNFGATDTRCMKAELPEAIKALEKKAGISERRVRRGR